MNKTVKCTLCNKDLTIPSRMFGEGETMQMHRQAHLAEWINEVYDFLDDLASGFGDLQATKNNAALIRDSFKEWTDVDLFDVQE